MTVRQAAGRLEVSTATVYGLVAAGKLRCHRIGLGRGTIRILEEHILEFLARCTTGVKPEKAVASVPAPKLKHLRL